MGEMKHLHGIPGFETYVKVEPVDKGWSGDKKYRAETADGRRMLLRVAGSSLYDRKKTEHEMMRKAAELGVPMCLPVEFGACAEGVYSLHSWIDGEMLEDVLPLLSEPEQYILGIKSGEVLRKIHAIPAPEDQEGWAARFNRKTDHKIKAYRECGLRFDGDGYVVNYIEKNRPLLENRPQCFQHGDYHVGNMMMENGEIKIIDFDRHDFGDPWEEFNRVVWSAALSPHFATGQLRGYFGGEPPIEFFRLLAFYISSNTLSSIYWAASDQSDLDTMMKQSQDVLRWFDNMTNPVPTWYLSGSEVCDAMWASADKVREIIKAGEMLDYPYFEDMVKWRAAKTEFVRDITEKAKKGVNEHE
jgi:serine/threonine-protein kinase